MSLFWWSWLLTIVGVTGFVLAGRKIWWAWYVNIACQALWFTYAIVSHQYGFIAASMIYAFVFTQNAQRWTSEHNDKKQQFEKYKIGGTLDKEVEPLDPPLEDYDG